MIRFKAIKTIVVLTAENPKDTKSNHPLLNDIKEGGYAYVSTMGKLGNLEKLYAVFNMSVETAKMLCGRYRQTSFVFTQFQEDGTIHSEYWEKQIVEALYHKGRNDYVKKEACDGVQQATDGFTVHGSQFKYHIPFCVLESVNRLFTGNIQRIIEAERKRGNDAIDEEKLLDFAIYRVGMPPYLRRKAIINGFYDNQSGAIHLQPLPSKNKDGKKEHE